MDPFITEIESNSALWLKIKAHYEARLQTLREQNDADRDPDKTAKLRGRIAEVKALLGLDAPPPAAEKNDSIE